MPNTTEHLVTSNNHVTLSPSIPTSFVSPGANQDGRQQASLSPGPSDGFEKTVVYSVGLPGSVLRVPLDAHNYVEIGDAGGACLLKWNAKTPAWCLVGGIDITTGVLP